MAQTKNIAPVALEVLVVIVHSTKQAYFSSLIQKQQVNAQFTVPCKGTTHLLMEYMGLAQSPKTFVSGVIRSDEAPAMMEILKETFAKGGDYKGLAFTIPLSSMIGALAYGFLSNEKKIKEA